MTELNPHFTEDVIEEINRGVIEIAPGFATAQHMIASAMSISRDQLSMGHIQQLTAIVAMAETVRQLNGGGQGPNYAPAVNEALDLLRQAVAPDPAD